MKSMESISILVRLELASKYSSVDCLVAAGDTCRHHGAAGEGEHINIGCNRGGRGLYLGARSVGWWMLTG